MQYYFRKYRIINGIDGALLLAQNCNMRITDNKMLLFLHDMEINNSGIYNRDFIESLLIQRNICIKNGLDFLEEMGILEEITESPHSPFDQAILLSDNMVKMEPLIKAIKSDGIKLQTYLSFDDLPKNLPTRRTLVIIFLEIYCSEIIRDIYRQYSSQLEVGFIQAYFFQREFRIDGLFIPSIGSPCHFCHFQRLCNREERSFSGINYSWYNLIKVLEEHDHKIPPSLILSDSDIFFATHILRRKIQQFMGVPVSKVHLDSFISATCADLIDCTTYNEPIPHWCGCDCIKNSF